MNRPIRALKRTPESGPYTAPSCQCCCSKYECNRSAELNFDSGVSGTFVVFGEVVLDIRKTQRVKWDGHTGPTRFIGGVQLQLSDFLGSKKDVCSLAVFNVKRDSLKLFDGRNASTFDGVVEFTNRDLRTAITLNLGGNY